MMTYTELFRRGVNAFKDAVVGGLLRLRVPADTVTFAGFLFSLAAAIFFATGRFPLGGLMIFFSGACDVFDGAVAKRSGRMTAFGGFFDSVLDRASDVAILGGAGFWYAAHGPLRNVALAFAAIGGSVLTSYTRARAENVGLSCAVGFWERAERTFMLMLAGFFWRMPGVLWELAVLANVTAAHRIYHVWRETHPEARPLPRIPLLSSILFWEHPRYTWQYDVYVGLGILLPLIIKIP